VVAAGWIRAPSCSERKRAWIWRGSDFFKGLNEAAAEAGGGEEAVDRGGRKCRRPRTGIAGAVEGRKGKKGDIGSRVEQGRRAGFAVAPAAGKWGALGPVNIPVQGDWHGSAARCADWAAGWELGAGRWPAWSRGTGAKSGPRVARKRE
jgi:hypothetical protein